MKPEGSKWVFFDLDGTLVETLLPLYSAYSDFLNDFGVKASKDEFSALNGPSFEELVWILKKKYQLHGSFETLFEKYNRFARKRLGRVRENPDALDAMIALKKRNFKIGLVTSASQELASISLKKASWAKLLDVRVFGDEVKQSKPSPDIYRLALKKTGCDASSAIAVEDSRNGVLSACGAGLKVLAFSPKKNSNLLRAGAAQELRSLKELKDSSELFFEPESRVSTRWIGKKIAARLLGEKPANLNNHIFTVRQMDFLANEAKISGVFIPYPEFIKKAKGLRMEAKEWALAVSGISVIKKDGREFYLIGKRSGHVHSYKLFWEFVPSGGVDGDCLLPSKQLDLSKMLLQEAHEEAGLEKKDIEGVFPFAVLSDSKVPVYDVVMALRLKSSVLQKKIKFNEKEYIKMFFLDKVGVEALFKKEKNVVPTCRVLWEIYQKGKK